MLKPKHCSHAGVNVISTDEKTGIQALEREITPMKAKFSERQDHEYARHGTQCLIANFNVVTGQIVSPSMGDTRTEEDFVEHIHRTIETMPSGSWVFVVDNLNTHVSEGLVKLVARLCEDSQAIVSSIAGSSTNMRLRVARIQYATTVT